MKITVYTIDFQLPKWAKRLLVYGGVPGALLLGIGTLVYADSVSVPNQFHTGDTLSAAQMNANFGALTSAMNSYPNCPVGYTLQTGNDGGTPPIVCVNGTDNVVKVGTGASAFWIDQYEASVWEYPIGSGSPGGQYGVGDAGTLYPSGFPPNGQWTGQVYAISVASVYPSNSITWFQANEACRASGKRLPTGAEWLTAARGTDAHLSECNTGDSSPLRTTGTDPGCVSAWGAYDMVGNVEEWTDGWYAAPGTAPGAYGTWPPGYGGAVTVNIVSAPWVIGTLSQSGLTENVPAAALRGGAYDWSGSAVCATNSLYLNAAPSFQYVDIGFRCMIPR